MIWIILMVVTTSVILFYLFKPSKCGTAILIRKIFAKGAERPGMHKMLDSIDFNSYYISYLMERNIPTLQNVIEIGEMSVELRYKNDSEKIDYMREINSQITDKDIKMFLKMCNEMSRKYDKETCLYVSASASVAGEKLIKLSE